MMPKIVSFISDFGLSDAYVGTVKAVMLSILAGLTVVDVTHDVAPQRIDEAVFLARQAWPYFPSGTVHLIVVDPGVGTSRRAAVLQTPRGYVVGPDNGVLSAALPERLIHRDVADQSGELPAVYQATVPSGYVMRSIENTEIVGASPSTTFHGRDVFGPAAARLAAGFPFDAIGPRHNDLFVLPVPRARMVDGRPSGVVIHTDHFGNLVTSIYQGDVPAEATAVEILDQRAPLVRTYGDREGLVALIGSSGYLEVAIAGGNASEALGAPAHGRIEVIVL